MTPTYPSLTLSSFFCFFDSLDITKLAQLRIARHVKAILHSPPYSGGILPQGHLCLLPLHRFPPLPHPLTHKQQPPVYVSYVCLCVCVTGPKTPSSTAGFDRLRSLLPHHRPSSPLAEGINGRKTILMSADIRTALNCLRHPSRFMPISRTQLSRVHTGDSIQNISEKQSKCVFALVPTTCFNIPILFHRP